MTSHNSRIADFFPSLFELDPPAVGGDDPIVLVGTLLKHSEVHFLPGGRGLTKGRPEIPRINLHGAFGSYGILKKIASSSPGDYYTTLWSKAKDVPTWIGSCNYTDSLEDLLGAISATKFGAARVTKEKMMEALITLGDLLGLISDGRLTSQVSVRELSSEAITIAPGSPILQALKLMISRNIRRLFLERGGDLFVSDRSLVSFMFDKTRLEKARDRPEHWLDGAVADLATRKAGRFSSGDFRAAAKAFGQKPDDCLITDDGRVISRWDMIIKPWRNGKLTIQGEV